MRRLLLVFGLLLLAVAAVVAAPLPGGLDGVRLAQTWGNATEKDLAHARELAAQAGVLRTTTEAHFPPGNVGDCDARIKKAQEQKLPLEMGLFTGWRYYFLTDHKSAMEQWNKVMAEAVAAANQGLAGVTLDGQPLTGKRLFDDYGAFIEKTRADPKETMVQTQTRYLADLKGRGAVVAPEVLQSLLVYGKACFAIGSYYFQYGRFEEAEPFFKGAVQSGYSFEGKQGSMRLSTWVMRGPEAQYKCTCEVNDVLDSLHSETIADHDGTPILTVYYDRLTPEVQLLLDYREGVVEEFQRLKSLYRYLPLEFLSGGRRVYVDKPTHSRLAQCLCRATNMVGDAFWSTFMLVTGHARKTPTQHDMDFFRHEVWGHEVDFRLPSAIAWSEGFAMSAEYHTSPGGASYLARSLAYLKEHGVPSYHDSIEQAVAYDRSTGIVYFPQGAFQEFLLARGNPNAGKDGFQCMGEFLASGGSNGGDNMVRIYGASAQELWQECFYRPDWDVRLKEMAADAFGWRFD